jgi:hypothetical protein
VKRTGRQLFGDRVPECGLVMWLVLGMLQDALRSF